MTSDGPHAETPDRTPWHAAFLHRDFNFFQSARLLSILGIQMQSIAIGWQIYAVTGRPIDLAWAGLAQFFDLRQYHRRDHRCPC